MTHICVNKLTIIGSDNGLSPGRRQAIIWTSDGILLIGPLRTNFSEILIGIRTFSFRKMHLKMSSAEWRPFFLGLNELNRYLYVDGSYHIWTVAFNLCRLRAKTWEGFLFFVFCLFVFLVSMNHHQSFCLSEFCVIRAATAWEAVIMTETLSTSVALYEGIKWVTIPSAHKGPKNGELWYLRYWSCWVISGNLIIIPPNRD